MPSGRKAVLVVLAVAGIGILILGITQFRPPALNLTQHITGSPNARWHQCVHCLSVRRGASAGGTVTVRSTAYGDCRHRWAPLLSNSISWDSPVETRRLVLLRNTRCYGAMMMTAQRDDPDPFVEYEFWYRSDGSALLDPRSDAVVHGTGRIAGFVGRISVGPLEIDWGSQSTSAGWLEYSHGLFNLPSPDGTGVCLTDLVGAEALQGGLDASSPQWRYRSTAFDYPIEDGEFEKIEALDRAGRL